MSLHTTFTHVITWSLPRKPNCRCFLENAHRKWKFGSSSTSGKTVQNVSIHYPGDTRKYKCKVCPSAVGTMLIFAIHHAPGPGNMHTHSKDTYYSLMPLIMPQLFHFVLVQPFCLLYFCCCCFGSCNFLTLWVSAAF